MISESCSAEKNTESKNPKFVKTKSEKTMLLSKCAMYKSDDDERASF